jgi:hypothetical protein
VIRGQSDGRIVPNGAGWRGSSCLFWRDMSRAASACGRSEVVSPRRSWNQKNLRMPRHGETSIRKRKSNLRGEPSKQGRLRRISK